MAIFSAVNSIFMTSERRFCGRFLLCFQVLAGMWPLCSVWLLRGITERNSFGALAWGGFGECFLLVRSGGGIMGALFSASAYPAQPVFPSFDLAVGRLIRYQVPSHGLFYFCQNRVGGFFLR